MSNFTHLQLVSTVNRRATECYPEANLSAASGDIKFSAVALFPLFNLVRAVTLTSANVLVNTSNHGCVRRMSGQLYKFKFLDDSASIRDIINNETISEIEVFIVREGCEKKVAKYHQSVDSLETRREGIYEILREVDSEFRRLSFFERDNFRVLVTGVTKLRLLR